MLSSNISLTCPYNIVNFGPLADDIVSLVWGIALNFNGFRVLAALLHSQTAALNRGRHLYTAGRPSRWELAHISSCLGFVQFILSDAFTVLMFWGIIHSMFIVSIIVLATCQWFSSFSPLLFNTFGFRLDLFLYNRNLKSCDWQLLQSTEYGAST